MVHDVFISYSNRDAVTANAVCAALEAGGIRCWIAPRDVPVGRPWKLSIVEAIRAARGIVLVFSSEANSSAQVRREVDIAFEARPQIPIFPFRIEDVEMSAQLYYCIGDSHRLDALTLPLEAHTERLLTALRERGYTSEVERHAVATEASPTPYPSSPETTTPSAVVAAVSSVPHPDAAHKPANDPAGAQAPSRASKRRLLLTASAMLLAVIVVVLGVLTFANGRLSAGAHAHGAEAVTAPVPASATGPLVVNPPLRDARPLRLDSTETTERRGRPTPDPVRAAAPTTPRPPVRTSKNTARGAVHVPDSSSVECARLLERVSLGEVLSGQESTRLTHYCRGAPI